MANAEDIRKLLDEIQKIQEQRQVAIEEGVGEVGIIYVIDDSMVDPKLHDRELFISALPFTELDRHDSLDWIDYSYDHDRYWRGTLIKVLRDRPYKNLLTKIPYDFFPRGRVVYNKKERRFYMYLDKCILKDRETVSEIMSEMNLSAATTMIDTDPHYKCKRCNPGFRM